MNLRDCYVEEDLFPKIFTDHEEREYGILFFNTDNKDSYDSNHAVIYNDKIHDLQYVLSDITEFYKGKGSRPIIYQSMLDDNWFDEIQEELSSAGFRSWIEDQEYMLQVDENRIIPNPDITVRIVSEWSDGIENVFIEAEEPWEIKVAKKTLDCPETWMFAASMNGKIVGLLYGHISERACRVDYLLVSKKHRKAGVGRALFYNYVEWCRKCDSETTLRRNADLKEELEYFKKRKACGRQRHNAKWMAIYNDFVVCHEQGMTMVEIAKRNGISERSIYRYKAYYDEMQKKKKGKS